MPLARSCAMSVAPVDILGSTAARNTSRQRSLTSARYMSESSLDGGETGRRLVVIGSTFTAASPIRRVTSAKQPRDVLVGQRAHVERRLGDRRDDVRPDARLQHRRHDGRAQHRVMLGLVLGEIALRAMRSVARSAARDSVQRIRAARSPPACRNRRSSFRSTASAFPRRRASRPQPRDASADCPRAERSRDPTCRSRPAGTGAALSRLSGS